MATYVIPPTSARSIQDSINAMADVFEQNADALIDEMVSKALVYSGIGTPKVSKSNIIQLMNSTIIPQIHNWEIGWVSNPNQPDNPSMKGVSLDKFISSFSTVFVENGVPAISTAARNWNNLYPLWRLDVELSKIILRIVCGRPKLGSLFVYHTFCSQESRYAIAGMTEDPWLGFILGQSVWSSGLSVFESTHADYSGIARRYGWNGLIESWIPFVSSLGDRTVHFALECFTSKYSYIRKLSKPEGPNAGYRNAWLERLVTSDQSDLMLLIKVTESFCLNSKRIYDQTTAESNHLFNKASIYKKMELVLPD